MKSQREVGHQGLPATPEASREAWGQPFPEAPEGTSPAHTLSQSSSLQWRRRHISATSAIWSVAL